MPQTSEVIFALPVVCLTKIRRRKFKVYSLFYLPFFMFFINSCGSKFLSGVMKKISLELLLQFCWQWSIFRASSILNIWNVTGFRIPGWQFYSFRITTFLYHCLLASIVSDKTPTFTPIIAHLHITVIFLCCLQDILFIYGLNNLMYLSDVPECYFLCIYPA